jgi:hypothetical protein
MTRIFGAGKWSPALLFAAAVTFAGSSPAHAQIAQKLFNTPAEKFLMAPGGVDMRTGRYVYSQTDLSIGDQIGGITFQRTMTSNLDDHDHPFGNLSHNWEIMISEWRVNMDSPPDPGQDYQINIHFGGRTQTYQSRYQWSQYSQVSSGTYAPLTYQGTRESASVVYTYTAEDGTSMEFRPIGNGDCSAGRRCAYISKMTRVDGATFSFSYAPTGSSNGAVRLAKVTSSHGYALLLEGSGSYINKACVVNVALAPAPGACPAGVPTATYFYTGTTPTRIERVVGVNGGEERFTYAAAPDNAFAMSFIKPGQSAPWLTNMVQMLVDELFEPQEIVTSQTFADGQAYTYRYNRSPPLVNRPSTIAGGTYTNARGEATEVRYAWPISPSTYQPGDPCPRLPCPTTSKEDVFTTYVYQQTPGPVTIKDPLLRTTTFQYCDPSAYVGTSKCIVLPAARYVNDPENIRTDLEYDGNGNVTKATRNPKPGALNADGTTPMPIVTTALYQTALSKYMNKPLFVTDGRGNKTTWTYYAAHGGVHTETGAAVDGVTPQKRYYYTERFAWVSNGAGGYVRSTVATHLLTSMSLCRTGNPSPSGVGCAAANDEVVTTYEYGPDGPGPNNLLLRGTAVTADGTTLRTCYGYDDFGRKISETAPEAGLAVCQ